MSNPPEIRFDERAENDVRATVDWYEAEQSGLGAQFVAELDATLAHVAEHPEMYRTVDSHVRRALTRKFPYSVYYRPENGSILVVAVLHTRRKPPTFDQNET